MSFRLKREIYGNNLWMVDERSFSSMWSLLSDFRNGISFEPDENGKCNSFNLYDTNNARLVHDSYDLRNAEPNDTLIGIINLDGVITKHGGMSSYGTKYLSNQIKKFEADSRVKGTLIKAASGGGSGQAIQYFRDTILECKKPVGTWIEKGEIVASAAYGCVSPSKFIMVENDKVEVGSLGTFIEFEGYPKENTNQNGLKHVRVYAPESTEKNFIFEEAINNSNYKPIIDELLTPANNEFLGNIQNDRPNIDRNIHMKGKMFKAHEVMGIMVDSIGSFEDAVNKILELSEEKQENTNININNSTMNKSELQSKFPTLYQDVYQEGVLAERDRVGSFMAHSETDLKAVQEGIESGLPLSNTQREKFLVKAHNQKDLAELENGAPNINATTPTTTPKSAEELAKEVEAKELAELEQALKG